MTQQIADRRDIDFVLYEQLDLEKLFNTARYGKLNKKMVDMVVTEARAFGIKEVLPTFAEGDKAGVHFDNGRVIIPECYRRPHQMIVDNEWTALYRGSGGGRPGIAPHGHACRLRIFLRRQLRHGDLCFGRPRYRQDDRTVRH